VVIDSHPLWVEGMTRLLERVGMGVAASSTEASDVLELVEAQDPDVLVVGLGTGPADNRLLDAIQSVRRAHPHVKVVMLAPAPDDHAIGAAFAMGVSAYCMKSAEPDDLMVAIRQSFERSIFLEAPWGGAAQPVRLAGALPSRDEDPHLTKREIEILRLVAEGHSNVQIAQRLWVTDQTVKFHLSNVYRKLNVANRTEASRWAQLHGLLPELTLAPLTESS
jgi:DNA-binding NarL/FixJ family response regulator